VVTVEETAAGSRISCSCGRTVVVPSLRELRRQSGEDAPALAPELAVEALLLACRLPEEDCCVLCGVATDGSVSCRTECERAYVDDGTPSWWVWLLGFLTAGMFGVAVVAASRKQEQEWGKDRIYSLPLRVCDACRPGLASEQAVLEALCAVPLYRQLLTRFPGTKVYLPAP
jgi:hypothetical protein